MNKKLRYSLCFLGILLLFGIGWYLSIQPTMANDNPMTWNRINNYNFGQAQADVYSANDIAEFNGDLYVTTSPQTLSSSKKGQVWQLSNGDWSMVHEYGYAAEAIAAFGDYLYVGFSGNYNEDDCNGADIYRTDNGTDWTQVGMTVGDDNYLCRVMIMQNLDNAYGDYLYAGFSDGATTAAGADLGAKVWRTDGSATWTQVLDTDPEDDDGYDNSYIADSAIWKYFFSLVSNNQRHIVLLDDSNTTWYSATGEEWESNDTIYQEEVANSITNDNAFSAFYANTDNEIILDKEAHQLRFTFGENMPVEDLEGHGQYLYRLYNNSVTRYHSHSLQEGGEWVEVASFTGDTVTKLKKIGNKIYALSSGQAKVLEGNSKPVISSLSATPQNNERGDVLFTFDLTDGDFTNNVNLSAKVEYKSGSTWNKATLTTKGSIGRINNSAEYQIIQNDSDGFYWYSQSDLDPQAYTGLQLRVTGYDGDMAGDPVTSSSFNVDLSLAETLSIVTTPGPGGGPHLRGFDFEGNALDNPDVMVYATTSRMGVNVAIGNIDSDEAKEIVVGPRAGGGPQIRVYDEDGNWEGEIWPFHHDSRSGIDVAVGDVDGDGIDEIAVVPEQGDLAHVKVYNFDGRTIVGEWGAYGDVACGGRITTGDVDEDGIEEVIVGAGPTGGPHIRVFEGNGQLKPIAFFAFHTDYRGGVDVSAADVNDDGKAEIAVVPLQGQGRVKVYRYDDNQTIHSEWLAYDTIESGGRLSVGDLDQNGTVEVVTGTFVGGPHVRVFQQNGTFVREFFAYDTGFRGGVDVAVD